MYSVAWPFGTVMCVYIYIYYLQRDEKSVADSRCRSSFADDPRERPRRRYYRNVAARQYLNWTRQRCGLRMYSGGGIGHILADSRGHRAADNLKIPVKRSTYALCFTLKFATIKHLSRSGTEIRITFVPRVPLLSCIHTTETELRNVLSSDHTRKYKTNMSLHLSRFVSELSMPRHSFDFTEVADDGSFILHVPYRPAEEGGRYDSERLEYTFTFNTFTTSSLLLLFVESALGLYF